MTVMTKWFRWSDRPLSLELSRLIARRIWIAVVIITGGLLEFPPALANKEVQSIVLAPSTVGPNTNFNITVTAFYDESVDGGRNDTNFNSMAYTIDDSTSCINNGSTEVLTTTPTAYGPYTVTSPNVADGTYSVSVDFFLTKTVETQVNPARLTVQQARTLRFRLGTILQSQLMTL